MQAYMISHVHIYMTSHAHDPSCRLVVDPHVATPLTSLYCAMTDRSLFYK